MNVVCVSACMRWSVCVSVTAKMDEPILIKFCTSGLTFMQGLFVLVFEISNWTTQ